MAERIPYVYRLKDRLNGKQYIGSRYGKVCCPEDLGVSYFTSRKEVADLFRADPNRFEKQILVIGTTEYVIKVEKSLLDMYNAVLSDEFYNRTSGKGIHPDDVRAGAFKEHAKRSPELYALIVKKMHAKNTPEKRAVILKDRFAKMTPDKRNALAQHMRDCKTLESNLKIGIASKRRALENPDLLSTMGKAGGKIGGPKGCKTTNAQVWKCLTCGKVSRVGPISYHIKASGHVGKERVS